MKRIFALILTLFLITPVFSDNKKREKVIELDEKSKSEFEYFFVEGIRCKLLGAYSDASYWFVNCLKILPHSSVVCYEIADLFFQEKKLDDALQFARLAVAENSTNIWYKILLANILQQKSMIEEACNVYADITSKYSNREEFYLIEASLYISVEKWQKAIDVFNRYEDQFGITEAASIEKIKLYTRLNDPKKASNELLKLINQFPHKSEYLSLLAELYFNYNEDKKGLQILNKLLKTDPENGFVHFYLADYYRNKNRKEISDEHIRIALNNDNLEVAHKIQYILKLAVRQDSIVVTDVELNTYMDILLQKHRDNLSVRALHADFLKKENKLLEARKELEYIVSKEKDNFIIWEELLLLCDDINDMVSLQRYSTECIKYFPDKPLPYILCGVSYLIDNDINTAISFFENGVLLANDDFVLQSQFYAHLGDCYYQLDSVHKAFETFDKALKINPNDIFVLNNYAYYLSEENADLSKAEKLISKALSLYPDNPTFLDTYAWVLYKRGDYSIAKYFIKSAIEKSSEPSSIMYEHYGDILYKNGEKDEAEKMWNKAFEIGNKHSNELRKKIESGLIPD